jgi:hypothetical protein
MAKMDMKKLALDHVEKAVFGILVLIVLLALAGTNWSPYSGTPGEITQKITQGRKTLLANTWPEEERAKYVITNEAAPANLVYERLFKEFSPTPVEMSGKMVVDVFGGNEPVREPQLLPPQDPIASSARVFLHLADQSTTTAAAPDALAAATPAKPKEDDAVLDEFRKRNPAAGGMPGDPTDLSYTSATELANENTAVDYSSMMMAGSGDPGEAGAMPQVELNGRGYHFVSVRAVFPLREQIMKYAEAIHKSYHVAATSFDIRNFELERQVAQPGDDPWTGPWEQVDLQVAGDILDKTAGFDAEVVNSIITNAVVTMPLPMRISGEWRKQATHPRIEKFELSDSEISMEVEMQRKLLEEAVNQRKEMDATTVKRGGFAAFQIDSRQLQSDLMGVSMYDSSPVSFMEQGMMGPGAMGGGPRRGPGAANMPKDTMEKLIEDLTKGSTNRAEEERRIRKWIQDRASAEGELLLFRYLDFNVDPGKTYRYRVKFVLANPNFGKRIADAGGLESVVLGETRETPWSQITSPVTVEDDVKYFITEVREQAGRILPTVRFDVFEWDPAIGTFINGACEIRMGQKITEEVETTVIEPAKFKNETRKYRFKCGDFLVDTVEDIRLDEAFHEKAEDGMTVKLPPSMRGKLALAPQALVKTIDGDLKYLNPIYRKKDHETQKTYMKLQAEQFEFLKVKENAEDQAALVEFGLADPGMGGDAPGGVRKRQKNQLRKQRGAKASGPVSGP